MTDPPFPRSPGALDTETSETMNLRGDGAARSRARNPKPDPERGTWDAGTEVAGRYRLKRFIARGGLGEVYEAENLEIGETVALKMLRPEKARDDETVERFRREFQLARRVTHPNVCRIHDAGLHRDPTAGPVLFLTMELLEGQTLEERLEARAPLDAEDSLPIVRQVCRALTAAHEVGVLHRDLKPSNVMLVPGAGMQERVVVTDFGLARAVRPADDDFRTAAGAIIGTPAAMSPEQVEGHEELTPATDIYSLGVMMFEMRTGQLPFLGKSPLETALRRVQEEAPRPSEIVPDLEVSWENAILACLRRVPSQRPRSAEDVLGFFASPTHAASSGAEPSRRSIPPWAAVLAAAVLAAGVGLWLGRATDRAETVPDRGTAGLVERRLVRLTTEAGLDIDPEFDPTGRSVVYSSDRGGELELWHLQLTAGGVARQLTTSGSRAVQPSWSPDGRWIAYTSLADGGIWRIPATGGPAEQLTSFGARPRFSPDGRRIAFQEDGRWEISARSAPAQPGSTVWVVDATGGEPHRWTDVGVPAGGHGEPSWTPNGEALVFSAGDRRASGVWVLDRPGGEPRPLLDSGWRWAGSPVLEKDGNGLLFSGIRADEREAETHAVWRLPLEDLKAAGPVERITRFGDSAIRQIALARDGEGLVYGSLETRSNLWEVELEGLDVVRQRALTRGNARASRPAISPDGTRVAFDRWQTGRDLDVYILDLGTPGEPPVQLTLAEGRDSQASWSPDGTRVVYCSERPDGRDEIWSVDVGDGTTELLAELESEADWARLAPDGSAVAYHSRVEGSTLDLWVLDLSTKEVRRVTRHPEPIGFPAWSPDGRRLAAEIQRGDDSVIAVVDVETGEMREILAETGKSWPYSWSPDGRWVAFAGLRADGWNLWVVSTAGEVRELSHHTLTDGYVRYPVWSLDGKRIVYELAETTGDLWLAER